MSKIGNHIVLNGINPNEVDDSESSLPENQLPDAIADELIEQHEQSMAYANLVGLAHHGDSSFELKD